MGDEGLQASIRIMLGRLEGVYLQSGVKVHSADEQGGRIRIQILESDLGIRLNYGLKKISCF